MRTKIVSVLKAGVFHETPIVRIELDTHPDIIPL